MDGFPSGQRGQTVNLLQIASVVRIHLHPLTERLDGPVAQLVRAPPCHGGGHGFESRLGRFSNCFYDYDMGS